jgi:hypothetical protein
MSLRKRKSGGPKKRRSRATKEQRVDVTRQIVESAIRPEIEAIALKVHRALDGEEWYDARMNLATMTGHFDEKFDTAIRLNMVLLEELEQASADGKFTPTEKKKVEQVKRGVDSIQKKLLDEYYEGSPSGVIKKKMAGESIKGPRSQSVEDERYRAMKEIREKALWMGTLIMGEPESMKKTIPHGNTDYAFVGVFQNPVMAVEEIHRLRGEDPTPKRGPCYMQM